MAASFSPATAAPKATAGSVQQVAFAPTGIFQSLEFETNATAGIDGWRSFFKRLAKEEASLEACTSDAVACPPTLRAWRGRLESWRTLTPRAKLIQVNRWANAVIHYGSDAAIYKLADHWATPGQSLLGRGDCEDYALLKYATLRALGFDENNLRIVVVNDLTKGIGHAVLSARTDEGTFILDNQDSRVLRHDTVSRYAPVYSINATGRWINIATRSLKVLKPQPVMLMASAEELGDVAPPRVILPKLKPGVQEQAQMPRHMPSGATAIAARFATSTPASIAMLLRPTVEG